MKQRNRLAGAWAFFTAACLLLASCGNPELLSLPELPVQNESQAQALFDALDRAAEGLEGEETASSDKAAASSAAPQESGASLAASSSPAGNDLRPGEDAFSDEPGYEVISPFAVAYDVVREGKDKYGNPPAVRPDKNVCTISISCATAVEKGVNKEPEFAHLPADGWILEPTEVEYEDGDCVFQVLARTVIARGIQMEYSGIDPLQYVEGIDNLYEFDGGRWSGWMYCVNDWYPNFGCGQYDVERGDVIEWNYTCDLGADLGQTWMGEGIDVDAKE